ncbi:hypothetical protein BD779DRAFT_1435509 [Infundibulicybe gibba]|nr:hypothetical protein BD779DRAFT_1435509 [Infundibulicybe gibba]
MEKPLQVPTRRRNQRFKVLLVGILGVVATSASLWSFNAPTGWGSYRISNVPIHAEETLRVCRQLNISPAPPDNFHLRTHSDRFAPGTPPVLLKNVTIWTGRFNGLEMIGGDLLLDNGLIKAVGAINTSALSAYGNSLEIVDGNGAWVSPGIVDIHSHLGVDSSPALDGASDTNSLKGLTLPWLRSLDGLNTHDDAYQLSIAGGVTTANVLPGSADAIGGQAFPIKLRPTSERSPTSMLLEPPYTLNGTKFDPSQPPRWRQMKSHELTFVSGRVYSGTRMDTIWAFRQAYDTARKVKASQDAYCTQALSGNWAGLGAFPEDLQWEALVDVLRGRVKARPLVHTHCYEATDLDGLVRLSNEFKFPIAAFHHAHETYLVPDLLKKAYGQTPAVALFATNARYKREAYRGSEFAPRILADNGLRVIMKSDHPVLNSRYLVYEAQQAHYYGLANHLALASVTSTPATVMGMDHRIGFIKPGYDADVVVWDSYPLALGATPKQVYIDGIPQIKSPNVIEKPEFSQHIPSTPNFDEEAEAALKYDGLPPLNLPHEKSETITFTNVSNIMLRHGSDIREVLSVNGVNHSGTVVVKNGQVICAGAASSCASHVATTIDLAGGSIVPALLSFGSPMGLEHIQGESSTKDGSVFDPLSGSVPEILGGDGSIIRAVDGLQYEGRDALIAYRAGVTTAITAPNSRGFLSGLSVAFNTGSAHKLARGAVLQDVTALHVTVGPGASTDIAALRNLLSGGGRGTLAEKFDDVVQGKLPLVVGVESADIMASLISLKSEVESRTKKTLQLTFSGASEAHLLAKEIGHAGIGVILTPARPFPAAWRSRRILAGPPLTSKSAIAVLLAQNVTVGLGVEEQWSARNLRFDVAWASLESQGSISKTEALALASVNLEKLLGLRRDPDKIDLVAVKGGSFMGFEGKIVNIISPGRKTVDYV